MKCKNCKHWEREDDNCGDCNCEKFEHLSNEKDGLGYWGDCANSTYIRTGEDFGCIHFEESTKSNNERPNN